MSDPMAVLAILAGIVTLTTALEVWDHLRRPPRRHPVQSPRLVVERGPEWDVISGPPEAIREYLLDVAREQDAGEPLPERVVALRRGGAR